MWPLADSAEDVGQDRNDVDSENTLSREREIATTDEKLLRERVRQAGSVKNALGIENDLYEALYSRAFHFLRLGYAKRAQTLFFVLCALDGGEVNNWLGFGACLQARGETELALAAFEYATKLQPQSPSAHLRRLGVLIQMKIYDEAREALEQFDATVNSADETSLIEAAAPFRMVLEMSDD